MRQVRSKSWWRSLHEAEIIGVFDGLSEGIWARNFLVSQALEIGPAIVFQENPIRERTFNILSNQTYSYQVLLH